MEKFQKLGLSKEILEIIKQEGFKEPSEIQEKAIPLALQGKDIIGGSATGSGKTLAFAAGIIQTLKPNGNVQCLVLTPTRELAEQVASVFEKFSKNHELEIATVYGGVGMEPQIKAIKHSDIIVGTPGRVLDHLSRNTLYLGKIKYLVLDEVDRMFDMGFRRDVEKILSFCSKDRQTMLFSATISHDIDHLAKKHTRDAVEISVQSNVDPSKLKQIYYDVDSNEKLSILAHLLKQEASSLVMVFTNTRRMADFLERNLSKNGIDALAIHGGLSQNQRNKVLDKFHGKGVKVLVCTDVAARGLDIKGVTHVYNFDIPPVRNDYVHRIGRTARAGAEGIAINLISDRDYENFSEVMKIDNINIERAETPQFEKIIVKTNYGSKERHFGGRNQSKGFSGGRSFNRGQMRGRRDFSHSRRGESESSQPRRSFGGRPQRRPFSGRRNSGSFNRNSW